MDDDQQFCLRWNNHQSTLISVFDTLLENGTLVDCTLAAEGKFLKAHKVVLSACSPYFAALLSQQYDKHPIFILKDVKFQELRAMMDYMYRGEVNISQDQLAALLKAAESLQIKGLSDNRGSSSTAPSQQSKPPHSETSATKTLPPPVPANKASGLTIENKRPLKPEMLDSDVSGSREGSTSPTSRKRKKIRRRSVENNNLIDNHDQHSNSSSHSMHTSLQSQALALTSSSTVAGVPTSNNTATSLSSSSTAVPSNSTNVLTTPAAVAAAAAVALKKTDSVQQQQVAEALKLQLVKHQQQQSQQQSQQQQQQQQSQQQQQQVHHTDEDERSGTEQGDGQGEPDSDDMDEAPQPKRHQPQGVTAMTAEGTDGKSINQSELMIEPKNEYDDGQDENVEDLTLDEEELLDDLDQAGPSHGGEGSSQGYAQWQMEREQNEAFLAAQDAVGGQHRDAQVSISAGPLTPNSGHGCDAMVIQKEVIIGGSQLQHQQQQQQQDPMDDQPCDLRLLTPSYLREFTVDNKAQQRELIAAAAAAAAVVAGNSGGGGGGGCGTGPLPVPLFKGIHITSPPTVPSIGGAYTCNRCGNSYARPHSLNRHIRFECGVEPKFECPVCHKKSKHKHNLVLHMRTHQHR